MLCLLSACAAAHFDNTPIKDEAQLRERAGADFACGQGRFRFERADDANEIEVIGCRRKAVYADTPGGWHRMTDFEPAETE